MHPDDMVNDGLATLAAAARANSDHGENNEQDLVRAVRLFLADYTDVHYAARLILTTHWEAATPGQRDRFEEAFGNHVTNLLVEFVPKVDFESVRIDPFLGDTGEPPLMIRVTFQTSDKQTIHFVLVIHQREGIWLIFDVIGEGISYVKTHRNQFGSEIIDTGLEAMIERFEGRVSAQGNR